MLYAVRLLIITITLGARNFSSFKFQSVSHDSKLSRRFSQFNNNIGNVKPVFPKVELEKQFESLRRILSFASFASVFAASYPSAQKAVADEIKGVKLTDLPYSYDALAPYINKQTLEIHHSKHHKKYVTTTNDMIKGTELEGDDVVSIVRKSFGNNPGLFNNAAQSFNHDFYWKSMKPNGGGKPGGKLAAVVDRDFGGYDNFRKEFVTKALTVFGSGWAWLVATPTGLKVTNTLGANNPLTEEGSVPLLTVDVWEHAYYLDYQNMRSTYVDVFMDHLVNWDAVAARLPKS